MNIKIDGLRDPEQIEQLLRKHSPQYLSLNFVHSDNQYIGEVDEAIYTHIPIKIRKTGIFANTDPLHMIYIAGRFSLTAVQLDGDESATVCEKLSAEGLEVLKTINHTRQFDRYEGVCNKLIIKDKNILEAYRGTIPLLVDYALFDPQKHYGLQLQYTQIDRASIL